MRSWQRACLFGLVCAPLAVAIAGSSLLQTTNADFNTGTKVNLTTGGGKLTHTVVESKTSGSPAWYRRNLADGKWELQLDKDDSSSDFGSVDACLDKDGIGATSTLTEGALQIRAGEYDLASREATLPDAAAVPTPGTGVLVDSVEFTSGATRVPEGNTAARASYVVTFTYSDATTADVTVLVPYKAETWTSPEANSDHTLTSLTDLPAFDVLKARSGDPWTALCTTEGVFVSVTNPETTKVVDSVSFAYATDADVGGPNWLGGALSLTLVVPQSEYEASYTYLGTYNSPDGTLDAGANALWYRIDTTTTLASDGSFGSLFFDCKVVNGTYGTVGGPGTEEEVLLVTGASSYAPTSHFCEGQIMRWRLELYGAFATKSSFDEVTFFYDVDADMDGYGEDGDITVADCDDADATAFEDEDWYADCDGDGTFDATALTDCGEPASPCSDGQAPDGGWSTTDPGAGADCDDEDDTKVGPIDWYADCDGDTYAAEVLLGTPVSQCATPGITEVPCSGGTLPPVTWVPDPSTFDCDDGDIANLPTAWYPDCDDDDAYDGANPTLSCTAPVATLACENGTAAVPDDDWSNTDPGTDSDCDDADAEEKPDQAWYPDCDGDTHHASGASTQCARPTPCNGGAPLGGFVHTAPGTADCDDDDAESFPGQVWYPDCDADLAFDGNPEVSCAVPSPTGVCADDQDPDGGYSHVDPGSTADCDDEDSREKPGQTWYPDCDSDGAFLGTAVTACEVPDDDTSVCDDTLAPDGGWANTAPGGAADCNDEDATRFPGQSWYPDCDDDGFFFATKKTSCSDPNPTDVCADDAAPDGGWSHTSPGGSADCDDEDALEFPNQAWYHDCDGDTFFDATNHPSCAVPANAGVCKDNQTPNGGWSHTDPAGSADCDDEDAVEKPGQVWYPDCDDDDFYDATSIASCGTPTSPCDDAAAPDGGYANIAPTTPDCDDEFDVTWPDNPDPPTDDGVDNDCDGDGHDECWLDKDADTFGSTTLVQDLDDDGCETSQSEADDDTDCDDNPSTGFQSFPGNVNAIVGNSRDDDCDGNNRDECYQDLDKDGVGTDTRVQDAANNGCSVGNKESATNTDCDDTNTDAASYQAVVPWYADCDGDGTRTGPPVNSCGPPRFDSPLVPRAEETPCDDQHDPDGGWSTTAPTADDCDDEDEDAFESEIWVPDCDDDGVYADVPTSDCGVPATSLSPCADDQQPDGAWTRDLPTDYDCADEAPEWHEPELWYPDCDADGHFDDNTNTDYDIAVLFCGPPEGTAAEVCWTSTTSSDGDKVAPEPGGVDSWNRTPAGDCHDNDADHYEIEGWYPDCDNDGRHNEPSVDSCGEPSALPVEPSTVTITSPCVDALDPDGGWETLLIGSADCNDNEAEDQDFLKWFPDCDGDTIFSPTGFEECGSPDVSPCDDGKVPDGGWTDVEGSDCDDENPLNSELADWWRDCDGDSAYDPTKVKSCGRPAVSPCEDGGDPDGGWVRNTEPSLIDCDDEDETEFPGVKWYTDADGDSFGDPTTKHTCSRVDPTDVLDDKDCDDDDDVEYPGQIWYQDADDDTYGDPATEVDCDRTGLVNPIHESLDCDDGDATIKPDAKETAADDVDQDCDGTELCFADLDDDGHRPSKSATVDSDDFDCEDTTEAKATDPVDDCDDARADTYLNAPEVWYDGIDQDCQGDNDYDWDKDGWEIESEDHPVGRDCEDNPDFGGASIHPNPPNMDPQDPDYVHEECESVDQFDNDCDGNVNTENGTYFNAKILGSFLYYLDKDADGEGSTESLEYYLCDRALEPVPDLFVDNNTDCDDGNAGVSAGAVELCNNRDDDCDVPELRDEPQVGITAVEAPTCRSYFIDLDDDGFGDATYEADETICVCPQFSGNEDNQGPCSDGSVFFGNVCWSRLDTDCNDSNREIHPVSDSERAEVIDGVDNDCDGQIPLVEIDCDNDNSFPLLPKQPAPGTKVNGPKEVGLVSCVDWLADGNPTPSVRCFGGTSIEITCGASGFWMLGTEQLTNEGYFAGAKRVGQLDVGCDPDVWDCDDQCPARCRGQKETCDGVDNDCEGADVFLGEDLNGVPDGMEKGLESALGWVVEEELDRDGDGHVSCESGVGSTQTSVTNKACSAAELFSDCNDLCVLSAPTAEEERCNGFSQSETCIATEGPDLDGDTYRTCGAWGDEEFGGIAEDIHVLVLAKGDLTVEVADDESSLAEVVPLVSPRPQAETQCDAHLAEELTGLGLAPEEGEDWHLTMLSTCIYADSCRQAQLADPDLAWPEDEACVGLEDVYCGTVSITLSDSADDDMYTRGAIPDCLENPDMAWHPEQVVSRTVWHKARILEARELVIDWECYRANGTFGCTDELRPQGWTSPYAGWPPETGGFVPNQLTRNLLRSDASWWKELVRFGPEPVIEGTLNGCWGNPENGVDSLRNFEITGGDCNGEASGAHRDRVEGPGDVVGVFFETPADCSTCLDGLDNNCNGLMDCADPACAECFVGQGVGCGGGKDTPCAQGGCATVPRTTQAERGAQLLISLLTFFGMRRRSWRVSA